MTGDILGNVCIAFWGDCLHLVDYAQHHQPRRQQQRPRQRDRQFPQHRYGALPQLSIHERIKLQFRAEFTNFFNMVSLNRPNATVGSATFGQITTARDMRQLQLGLRTTF
jgi:hypothetical protein